MPWKKSEPMEERIEFGLRALGGGNFRALCREYGITARTGLQSLDQRVNVWFGRLLLGQIDPSSAVETNENNQQNVTQVYTMS